MVHVAGAGGWAKISVTQGLYKHSWCGSNDNSISLAKKTIVVIDDLKILAKTFYSIPDKINNKLEFGLTIEELELAV